MRFKIRDAATLSKPQFIRSPRVTTRLLHSDRHVHTIYSRDCGAPDAIPETAREAARRGVAIALNPRYPRESPAQAEWLFRLFLEAGCRLTISSDAHSPDLVGCRGPRYAPESELWALGVTADGLWDISHRVSAGMKRGKERVDR